MSKIFTRKLIYSFFLCFFIGILTFAFILYGPISYFRDLYVTTAMTTLSHQYMAKMFYSDKKIKEIMEKNKIKGNISNSNSADIEIFSVTSSTYNKLALDITLQLQEKEKNDLLDKKREYLKQTELKEIKGPSYEGYMLIINDPSRVKVVSSDKLGLIGVKLKDIMIKHNVFAGINAGGFVDAEGKGFGGVPTECIISDSKVIFGDINKKYDIIGFNKSNVFILGRYNLTEAIENGIRDAVAFSPFLVVNGEPVIKEGNGGWGMGPRTAIGQTKDGKVLMLVIDGRQFHSIGATLKDVQDIMLEYGAHNAANLDGGSSTVMYIEDKLINKPCSEYGERFLPSAFVVEKLK